MRTGGTVGTDTAEVVEMVNTRATVLTRLAITLIDLQFTQASRVAGFTIATVVIGTINAPATNTQHVHAVVWVDFTASTVVS